MAASLLKTRAMAQRPDPRLQPPEAMPEAQCEVWRLTVNHLPAEWFSAEQSPVLTAYCRHVVRAAQLESALTGLDPIEDLDQFERLTRLAGLESAKIAMHARSMRLTQQSRLKAETAHGRGGAAASVAALRLAGTYDDLLPNE
jgi:hypothetical protein